MWNEGDSIRRIIGDMPGLEQVFLLLFVATWLIGGNLIVARHYRRIGESPWSGFKPSQIRNASIRNPWKRFNTAEWLMLAGIAVIALTFGFIGMVLGEQCQ